MKVSIVLGSQFGDEGKGSFTNYLAKNSENPIVIRFNGGHQAGHSVLENNVKHIFSSFGSGTLSNATTFWSKYCTVYPIAVYNEFLKLKELSITPKIYYDNLCPITTPYDVIANTMHTEHGTVGVGFGTTLKRHEDYYKLYYQDIFNEKILKAKLYNIKSYYKGIIEENLEIENLIENWLFSIKFLIKNNVFSENKMGIDKLINDKFSFYSSYEEYTDHIIFEGAQGILLDMDYGFFPNVTRSNTTCKNALEIISHFEPYTDNDITNIDIYYISRIYQTRHGIGYMSNREHEMMELINTENEINIDGGFQGKFRKSLLDLDLIKYALICDANHHVNSDFIINKNIVLTCLDQVKDINNIRYTYQNEVLNSNLELLINKIKNITKIKNIIKGSKESDFIKPINKHFFYNSKK